MLWHFGGRPDGTGVVVVVVQVVVVDTNNLVAAHATTTTSPAVHWHTVVLVETIRFRRPENRNTIGRMLLWLQNRQVVRIWLLLQDDHTVQWCVGGKDHHTILLLLVLLLLLGREKGGVRKATRVGGRHVAGYRRGAGRGTERAAEHTSRAELALNPFVVGRDDITEALTGLFAGDVFRDLKPLAGLGVLFEKSRESSSEFGWIHQEVCTYRPGGVKCCISTTSLAAIAGLLLFPADE